MTMSYVFEAIALSRSEKGGGAARSLLRVSYPGQWADFDHDQTTKDFGLRPARAAADEWGVA